MTITLDTTVRTGAVDRATMIPAVVYGRKQPNCSIALSRKEFEKVFKEAGESSVVTLRGLEKPIEVLIHEVSFHPIKGGIQHVDFYALEKGKAITTEIPLEFIGETTVDKIGGMITKVLHEIEVTCQPADLPHQIEVDISGLNEIDAMLHVSDLVVPKGVTVDTPATEVVAIVVGQLVEEEETLPKAEVAPAVEDAPAAE